MNKQYILNFCILLQHVIQFIRVFVGIVLMSFQWGYLVDTKGRKRVLILSSLGAGVFSTASAFMPELISFVICKLLTALW